MANTEGIVAATMVEVFDLPLVRPSSDVLPDGEVNTAPVDVLVNDEFDCDEPDCDEGDCAEGAD